MTADRSGHDRFVVVVVTAHRDVDQVEVSTAVMVDMSRDDNSSEPSEAALLRVVADLWGQIEELRRGHGSPTYASVAKQIQRPKSTVSG